MTGLLAFASIAALTVHAGTSSPPHAVEEEVVARDRTLDVRKLHEQFGAEAVERPWAELAAKRLEGIYDAIPGVGFVSVRCATTICEVSGLIAPADAARTIDSLQANVLREAVAASGFRRQLGSGFRETEGEAAPGAAAVTWFTTYWQRQAKSGDGPRVIATSPASGAVVPAGKLTLSITFDRPMPRGSVEFTVPSSAEGALVCDGLPQRSHDQRTFAMQCLAQTGRAYAVGFETSSREQNGAAAKGERLDWPVLRFRAQ